MKQTYFLHAIVLFMNIFKSLSQQCTTSYIQKYLDGKLAETDYRPLLSLEGKNYGKTLGKCVYMCDIDQRCIGFDICKLTDTLFRCRTCCEWRKIKGYTIVEKSRCKRIEKQCRYLHTRMNYQGSNIPKNRVLLNSTATLSSEYAAYTSASNAVDGIKNCSSYSLTAVSKYSNLPWLLIQLESTYNIKKVVVYARKYYGFQADDIVVSIRGDTDSHICGGGIYRGPTANDDVIIFMCPPESSGRNVHIQKTTMAYLGLCEVEAYGYY